MCGCFNHVCVNVWLSMPNLNGTDTILSGAIAGTLKWKTDNIKMSHWVRSMTHPIKRYFVGGQVMDIKETFLICFHIGLLYNELWI